MKNNPIHYCSIMEQIFTDQRTYIGYNAKFREYFINMRHEKMIVSTISYCPWCGKKLPKNLRDEWFDILEAEYNLSDPWEKEQEKLIPEDFQNDMWWRKRGL